jgi:hypothetical protein
MIRSLSSFCRLMAYLLILTVMSSSVASAAYLCPNDIDAQMPVAMTPLENCAGMDVEKPALCATQLSGVQLALEHLAVEPALAPITVSTIAPVFLPRAVSVPLNFGSTVLLQLSSGSPYLRTQRLRI